MWRRLIDLPQGIYRGPSVIISHPDDDPNYGLDPWKISGKFSDEVIVVLEAYSYVYDRVRDRFRIVDSYRRWIYL